MNALTLDDGAARAEVLPDLGAALASYELADGTPLFRRAAAAAADPFALANILLVPWSNRIGGGNFEFDGEFYALPPNVPGDASPLHGSGFQKPWRVKRTTATRVELELECDEPAPFRYTARASYELVQGALECTLSVVNTADVDLPYGLGIHPWMPRTPRTTLLMPASDLWVVDSLYLPTEKVPVATRPELDFSRARALPDGEIANAFGGWTRQATLLWPERGTALDIVAEPGLDVCILYSPGKHADFICVEPVTHPPNAHNLPGGPTANGLVALLTDEELSVTCRFVPRRVG